MSRLRLATGALTALGLSTVGFIATWEGLSTQAYPDPVSRGEPWTICYGETRRPDGSPVRPGDTDTAENCKKRLLDRIVADFEPAVVRCAGADIAAEMPGGLYLSFLEGAYNYGAAAACSSTAMKRARARDWKGACDALTWYVKAGGRTIQGLVNRRNAAHDICLADLKGVAPKKLTHSRSALSVDAVAEPPARKKTCFLFWCW